MRNNQQIAKMSDSENFKKSYNKKNTCKTYTLPQNLNKKNIQKISYSCLLNR